MVPSNVYIQFLESNHIEITADESEIHEIYDFIQTANKNGNNNIKKIIITRFPCNFATDWAILEFLAWFKRYDSQLLNDSTCVEFNQMDGKLHLILINILFITSRQHIKGYVLLLLLFAFFDCYFSCYPCARVKKQCLLLRFICTLSSDTIISIYY